MAHRQVHRAFNPTLGLILTSLLPLEVNIDAVFQSYLRSNSDPACSASSLALLLAFNPTLGLILTAYDDRATKKQEYFQSYLRSNSDSRLSCAEGGEHEISFNPTLGLILTGRRRRRCLSICAFNPTLGLILTQ